MTVGKIAKIVFGFGVSGLFVWMVLRAIPFGDVVAALGAADPAWIVAALSCFAAGYACRIWRWRLMLGTRNATLTWGRCAVPFMASIAANNVLPFRAGDALRAVVFSSWLGVPTASVLATLLAERLLDLLSLLLALGLALLVFRSTVSDVGVLVGAGAWTLVGLAVLVSGFLLFPRAFAMPFHVLIRFLGIKWPHIAETIQAQLDMLFDTLAKLAQRSGMPTLVIYSLIAWTFEGCVFYSAARAIPELAEPMAAWLAMPVGTLSTLLPSTPGYVGTFHYFVILATESLENTAVTAAAFAVLVHLALWVPATLWGAVSFIYWMITRTPPPSSKKAFST